MTAERRDCSPKGSTVRRLVGEARKSADSEFKTYAGHWFVALHPGEIARLLALAYEDGLLEGQSRVTADASGAVRGEKAT